MGDNLLAPDDGTCDQLGEKGNEKAVVKKARAGDLSFPKIDQIGDLLEGEERDGKGKSEVQRMVETNRTEEEVGILEQGQNGQVSENAKRKKEMAPALV